MAVEIKEMVVRTIVTSDEGEADGKGGGIDAKVLAQLREEIIQECLHKVAEMVADLGEP